MGLKIFWAKIGQMKVLSQCSEMHQMEIVKKELQDEMNANNLKCDHIKEAHDAMAMQQTPAKGCPNIEPKGIASGEAKDTKTAGSNRNKIITLS